MATRSAVLLMILLVASCKKAPDSSGGSGSGSPTGSNTPIAADAPEPTATPDAAAAADPIDAAVATPAIDAAAKQAAQHESCLDGGACDAGLTCVKFVGVTGRQLASCEIACPKGRGCPSGQICRNVKDGPGMVCQTESSGAGSGEAGSKTMGGAGEAGSGSAGGSGSGSVIGSGSALEPAPGSGGGSGGTGSGSGSTPSGYPKQGQKCPAGTCGAGLECVEYYGIAGPRGPKFTSCEIKCDRGKACPGGQHCTTIADGPGQVCRP